MPNPFAVQYSNLILDEMDIEALSADDEAYLREFTSLESLAMNGTSLRSLANFPANENLTRLELAENKLSGDELKHLQKYAGSLHTLKLTSNKFSKLEQLDHLVSGSVGSDGVEGAEGDDRAEKH